MKIISLVHTILEPVNLDPVITALSKITISPKNSHEIIVIENGLPDSQDNKYPNLIFLNSSKFLGIPLSLNEGIRQALQRQADYIWITDPSISPHTDMFTQLLQAADRYRDCIAFTPKIYSDQESSHLFSAGYTIDWSNLDPIPRGKNEIDSQIFSQDVEIDYIPISELFVRSKLWSEVGLIDTRYFLKYFDMDLYLKIRNKGYRLNLISLAHGLKISNESKVTGTPATYYELRDKMYFSLLRAPLSNKITSLKNAYDKYFHGSPWQRRAVLDLFTANLGGGSYQWE